MKLSALIEQLQRKLSDLGDVPVYIDTDDWCEPLDDVGESNDAHIPSRVVTLR